MDAKVRDAVALGCFGLSGCAGLIYEVAWIRQASLAFGATTLALSTVLAVFFGGLALGGWIFGRVAERTARPLRAFALVELSLAMVALASPLVFAAVDRAYGAIFRATAGTGADLVAVRALLVALAVLPAAFLMGGTLPLLCRQFVDRDAAIARGVGALYAINTLGAAAGCALAGFVLLRSLGLAHTVHAGVLLNLVAGGTVFALRAPPIRPEAARAPDATDAAGDGGRRHRIVYALAFAIGFAALGGEVLWTRYFHLLFANDVHTYTLALCATLAGIVLGSGLAAWMLPRSRDLAREFGALQVAGAVCALALMRLPAAAVDATGRGVATYFALLLPAAALSGASFPVAVRLVAQSAAGAAGSAGRVAAVNTLGGIAGSLFVGFVALPRLGMDASLWIVSGASLASGLVACFALRAFAHARARATFAASAVALLAAVPLVCDARIPADLLGERSRLVDFREGYGADLAVLRGKERVLDLEIDRWWQGSSRKNHQVVAAHLPMLLHSDPRRVLVIGVGAGQAPARFLMHPIERLDAVDLEPTIFDFVRRHFDSAWMDDPRVRLVREDGRNFVRHSDAVYDVVAVEVGQVFRPGVALFYTREFYRSARARLAPGGVLAQFVPLAFFTTGQLRSVIRTFTSEFPASALWFNTSELLLTGFASDAGGLAHLDARLAATGAARDDLRFAYFGGKDVQLAAPGVLAASLLAGPQELSALAEGGEVYADDRPVLDYATSGVRDSDGLDAPNVALLERHLAPLATPALAEVRRSNLASITAERLLRQVAALEPSGDYASMARLLEQALGACPMQRVAARWLGDSRLMTGDFEGGRAAYDRALTIDPDDALAHLGLGNALFRLGRIDDAVAEYRTAVRLDPGHAGAHGNLGAALGSLGRHEQALEQFEAALRLDPGFAAARAGREQALRALKRSP